MQSGEKVSIPEKEPPVEEEGKKKIKIRFSVFFDGTLNNRTNVNAGIDSKAYRDAKSSIGLVNDLRGVVSYENALSNVAKMEEYVDTNNANYIFSTYIEGQGTTDFKADSFFGKALGLMETGVTQRARKGINEIVSTIQGLGKKIIIEKLTIDVFGFSRGAAAARNFLHQAMNNQSHGRNPAWPLKRRLEGAGFEVELVEVQFAGLFDTVSSVGLPSEHKNNSSRLHLNAISYAKDVVHLAAAEEHRANFSLTNTSSAGTKEIYLPGVHSDIGGGYTDHFEEDLIIFKGDKTEMLAEKARLKAAGWFEDEQMNEIGPSRQTRGPARRIWKLGIKRIVRNKYDRIPLHIMAEFARKSQINLISDLETDNELTGDLLVTLLDQLKSYANRRSSRAEDWQGNEPWLKELRGRFLHFSAHYSGTGMEPRFVDGKRKRLVYEG